MSITGKVYQLMRITSTSVCYLGRDMLYPIVGYSNYASILWRLHFMKLKFHQTAPLPFDRVGIVNISSS